MPRSTDVALLALLAAGPASAHHEAIFGPQSSLVLSAPAFLSAQMFSRKTRGSRETTGLISAGFSPFAPVPLSFTVIVPATELERSDGTSKLAREDVIVGTRYKLDLTGLQRKTGKDGNFLMGVAAVDLPTGNLDHKSFDGPLVTQAAALGSLEGSVFSGIAYGYWRRAGPYADGSQKGQNLFLGTGFAWTPYDDEQAGRLFSLQLGLSYEIYARDDGPGGVLRQATGGTELLAHPTVVFAPGGRWLFFTVVSLPLLRQMRDPATEDQFRIGLGALFLLGDNPKA